jgi:hypothetical protein
MSSTALTLAISVAPVTHTDSCCCHNGEVVPHLCLKHLSLFFFLKEDVMMELWQRRGSYSVLVVIVDGRDDELSCNIPYDGMISHSNNNKHCSFGLYEERI